MKVLVPGQPNPTTITYLMNALKKHQPKCDTASQTVNKDAETSKAEDAQQKRTEEVKKR